MERPPEPEHGLADINRFLESIGEKLSIQVNAYHIGGNAMCIHGLKETTRDSDLVVLDISAANEFKEVLLRSNFIEIDIGDDYEYGGLDAFGIFEENMPGDTRKPIPNRMRFDIFVGRICGLFNFSEGMVKRSKAHKSYKNLETYVCSKEDIFLFKAITTRLRDREDLDRFIQTRLDWKSIISELEYQLDTLHSDKLPVVKEALEKSIIYIEGEGKSYHLPSKFKEIVDNI